MTFGFGLVGTSVDEILADGTILSYQWNLYQTDFNRSILFLPKGIQSSFVNTEETLTLLDPSTDSFYQTASTVSITYDRGNESQSTNIPRHTHILLYHNEVHPNTLF